MQFLEILGKVMQFSGPAVTAFGMVIAAFMGYQGLEFVVWCFVASLVGQLVALAGSLISLAF